MTRAGLRLLAGDLAGSIRMQPLLLPTLGASVLVAFATVHLAFRDGSLMGLWGDRLTRVAIVAFVVAYVAVVGLWLLRFAGCFGGAVPV